MPQPLRSDGGSCKLTCDVNESQIGAVSFSLLPNTQQEASVALARTSVEQWQYTLRVRMWNESQMFMKTPAGRAA